MLVDIKATKILKGEKKHFDIYPIYQNQNNSKPEMDIEQFSETTKIKYEQCLNFSDWPSCTHKCLITNEKNGKEANRVTFLKGHEIYFVIKKVSKKNVIGNGLPENIEHFALYPIYERSLQQRESEKILYRLFQK